MLELAATIVVSAVALTFFSDAASRAAKMITPRRDRVQTANAKHSAA